MRNRRLPVLPFLLYAVALIFIFFNRGSERTLRIYEYDKGGYYAYLPSMFIHGDLADLRYYLRRVERLRLSDADFAGGTHVHSRTGRRVIKYPVGMAMAELPAFLCAHALARPLGYAKDGFSPPYAAAVGVTGIISATLGLWWLSLLLLYYFPRRVVAVVIAAIGVGTNLFTYAAFEPGMSHPVSFCLVSGLLLFAERWYRTGRANYAVFAGLLLGLIVSVRPVNGLFAIPALFWNAGMAAALRERLRFLAGHFVQVGIAMLCFALMLVPQLLYWKYVSGSWFYYSYRDEGFDFSRPHIWSGLFSYERGWLVYTPLMAVAASGLLLTIRKARRQLMMPVLFGVCILVYVVFSWTQWYYGAGFGARALIEALPLMAVPLAAVIELVCHRSGQLRVGILALVALLVAFNLFQTYQYASGTIAAERMNRAYYWRVFGKLHATDEDRMLLRK